MAQDLLAEDESARQFLRSCETTPATDQGAFKRHLNKWLKGGGVLPALVQVIRTEMSVHRQQRLLDQIKTIILEDSVSDHPDVPRVTFDDDGESLNIEEAVEKFRNLLLANETKHLREACLDNVTFTISIQMRSCDCQDTWGGRDSGCPLHGDGS